LSPAGVLSDKGVQERLKVTPELAAANRAKLQAMPDLLANIVRARDLLDDERGERWKGEVSDADTALYDGGFFDDNDKRLMSVIRAAKPADLGQLTDDLHDQRLRTLLPRYKARNYPKDLSDEERAEWERYRHQVLMEGGAESRLAKFMHRLGELAQTEAGAEKRYLLEELQLYAESIMPVLDTDQ
jgi:exodeoxyribonuclease-1